MCTASDPWRDVLILLLRGRWRGCQCVSDLYACVAASGWRAGGRRRGSSAAVTSTAMHTQTRAAVAAVLLRPCAILVLLVTDGPNRLFKFLRNFKGLTQICRTEIRFKKIIESTQSVLSSRKSWKTVVMTMPSIIVKTASVRR